MSVTTRRSEEQLVSDDLTLASSAAEGDVASFSTLLRRHDDKMRGVVWRVVGGRSAMDDVLQEAYLKAWRAMPGWRGDAAFSSWLYRIVYNAAIDHVRRRPSHLAPVDDGSIVPDHASAVADSMALRAALATLPPDQLAVVTLVDGEGRSYDEVAGMLDISPGTVGSRLHRARASLRHALAPTGQTPTIPPNEDLR